MTQLPLPETPSTATSKRNYLPWILGGVGGLVVLLLCGLMVFSGIMLNSLLRRGSGPVHGTQVTFQAQVSDGKRPSAAAMQQAANILTERAKLLEVGSYSFQVSGADQITARLPKNEKLDEWVKSLSQIGLIEFVDMGDQFLNNGTEIRTDFSPSAQAPANAPVYHTILTGKQIKTVGVTNDQQGKVILFIELNDEGTQLLYQFSKNNVGTYLAITIDKIIIEDPRIESAIPDGKAVIQGNFTRDSANRTAALLRTPPLPFALKVVGTKDY